MEKFMKDFQHLSIQLEEIKSATNNFDDNRVIGKGGFGKVYKGEITHSKGRATAAFKCLDRKYGQGESEFWKEIITLCCSTHKNLISLLGFCDEGDVMILAYEYASNGSLDRHLSASYLTWIQRIHICLDVAGGLNYLHNHSGGQQRVLHRDIKSSNILLDENWNAKVSDLGLSRIAPANQAYSFQVTHAVGTIGYIDPVYLTSGILTKESDVYSFGVMLLEVLCGRLSNVVGLNSSLVPSWRSCYEQNKLNEMIFQDPMIQQMDSSSLKAISVVAYQCLEYSREKRPMMEQVVKILEIALQFQIDYTLNMPEKYAEILRAMPLDYPRLSYRSIEELKVLLSKGILLNKGKKWFLLNKNEEHCEMISSTECLTPDYKEGEFYFLTRDYNSRFFTTFCYKSDYGKYRTRVTAQFLSPEVTYTVNLVFKFDLSDKTFSKLRYIGLRYKLEGETKSSIKHFADEREDGWVSLELYQFFSDGKTFDLKIQFEGSKYYYPSTFIEGIEFRPPEKVEHEVFDDQNVVDMQPTSDSEFDWEKNLPNDCEEVIKSLKDSNVTWTTNEELYYLLCAGFSIKEGGEWFYLAKNGKKCYILPARVALNNREWSWQTSSESRFGQEAFDPIKCFGVECKIKCGLLSPQETYGCYLIYKLPEDASNLEDPVKLRDKDFDKEDWQHYDYANEDLRKDGWEETDYRFIFLASPSPTPIIGQNVDQNLYNPSRQKLEGLPKQRDDGWMEVKIWEFQTVTTNEIEMRVDFVSSINIRMIGLIVQGIEFRPI